jgi:hypothetical protein
MAKMEMEMALAKMKPGPKKHSISLNDAMASIKCRYSIEMTNSKKRAQVLRLGGAMYSLVILRTQIICQEKRIELSIATLLNKMCIPWCIAGGKNKDKKGSNDNKELVIPAIATGNKGESKGGEKKTYKNPNKDKFCNHCQKKGHVEASCWQKHPDKIPKKVKAARNKAKACKSSAATVAINKEIILGIVKSTHIFVSQLRKRVIISFLIATTRAMRTKKVPIWKKSTSTISCPRKRSLLRKYQ